MIVAMFILVTLLAFVTFVVFIGDMFNEVKARRVFPKIASEVGSPRYVVNDEGGLNDPFFDLPDLPDLTEEVPVDRRGSRPPSICPPMLIGSGLAEVMADHLRNRISY